MIKVLIRTDASNATGMGHINRCVSLARHLEAEGMEPLFVLRYISGNVVGDYRKLGIKIFLLEEDCSLNDEACLLAERFASQYPAIVFDFSHYQNMALVEKFVPYFELLQSAFLTTFLIDGLNDTAIIDHIDPAIDVVITPYISAEDRSPGRCRGFRHWTGPSYFIFAPEYTSENWQREVRSTVERLLITMGGSDPYELTLIIIDALKLLESDVRCRVVIGPGFSEDLKLKIKDKCLLIPFCEIVVAPPTLVPHLKWAEMAISASGLTKYEMALTGVPSLQLSFNQQIAETTAEYEKEGFYRDLGLFTERTPIDIAFEIDELARNFEIRKSMIKRGQALFGESGIQRLIRAVRDGKIDQVNCKKPTPKGPALD
jgi:UDP-2,4-diacetamido-2,4,6-trideoxy-beta-L-altropyranose hydrolase